MSLYEIMGIITVVMSVGIHVPYLVDAIRVKIKPHPFTWILWTLLTIIVFVWMVQGPAHGGQELLVRFVLRLH